MLCHWSLPENQFFKLTHNTKLTFSAIVNLTECCKNIINIQDIQAFGSRRYFHKITSTIFQEKSIFATWQTG